LRNINTEKRRQTIRLQSFDYTSSGAYFVTICTHEKQMLFGEIVDGEMVLNELGLIVREEWFQSQIIRKEIELDAFIVMPNHLHGVVWIANDKIAESPLTSNVGAHGRAPLRKPNNELPSVRAKKSLGSFVAGFKSACTKRINEFRQTPRIPIWQRNYYERIIRNDDELNAVRTYIENNPQTCHDDEENL
jgi:putative transposase